MIVGLILIAILARRAVLEERTLQRDLRGYSDYMAQVRYRFIPHWGHQNDQPAERVRRGVNCVVPEQARGKHAPTRGQA